MSWRIRFFFRPYKASEPRTTRGKYHASQSVRILFSKIVCFREEETISNMFPVTSRPNFFNLSLSQRKDSSIYAPLYMTHKKPTTEIKPLDVKSILRQKRKLAVWIVSHCNAESHRDVYLKQLSKYIPIDVFGACSNPRMYACRPAEHRKAHLRPCKDVDMSEYKFYFAAENSLCKDYITGQMLCELKDQFMCCTFTFFTDLCLCSHRFWPICLFQKKFSCLWQTTWCQLFCHPWTSTESPHRIHWSMCSTIHHPSNWPSMFSIWTELTPSTCPIFSGKSTFVLGHTLGLLMVHSVISAITYRL